MSKEYKKSYMDNFYRNIDDNCYISFNCFKTSFFCQPKEPETAIVINGQFFILKGDQRKHFDDCDTLEQVRAKAKQLYKSKEFQESFWSDDWEELFTNNEDNKDEQQGI